MIRLTKQKSKYSDELVKEIINFRLDGVSPSYMAKKYSIPVKVISSWTTGSNRGHLPDAVRDQREKEGKL